MSEIPDIPEGDTSWADDRTIIVDLGRVFTEDIDVHWLSVQASFVVNHTAAIVSERRVNWWIRAKDFRLLELNTYLQDQIPDGFNHAIQQAGGDNQNTEARHTRMISLTRFTVGENDGLKIGFAGHPSDIKLISDIRIRAELHPDISELRLSAKETSGAAGGTYLNPRSGIQKYEAKDENRVVNEDGSLVRVVKGHPDAHGKVVEKEDLNDTRFRGFFSRVADVVAPQDDEFVYALAPNLAGGGFEKYSVSSPVGFRPGYDPFAVGEPWHRAPVADTVDYVGALTYRGHTLNEASMKVAAGAAGEAFVLLQDQKVVFVDEYTPPDDGRTHFVGEPLVAGVGGGGPESMVAFWGSGQTEEVGGAILRELTSLSRYRWEFGQAAPNDIIFGTDPGVVAVTAANASDADLLGTEVLGDLRVLQFPPGRYLIDAFQITRANVDANLRAAAYQVMTGDDDHLVEDASGYNTNASADPLGVVGGTGNLGQTIHFPVFTFAVPNGETGQLTFITGGLNILINSAENILQKDSAFRVFVTKVA